ncbi:MAG: type III-B CRISPR module RAMP protein Cmr4, partial [Dehalococcoidia bacterium]|nr:type III-B CRISPR module RAMP protein Cmr4 [Dehalococcoidia bacterium]
MFEASALLFLYVETPLHAGTGRSFGLVDLPIQRERTTDYPMVQASSIKGRLRAESEPLLPAAEHTAIFGPKTANASEHAGALSPGDARLVLFPVRSLAGVFAWTTSVHLLARLRRDAALAGLSVEWQVPPEPGENAAWVNGDALIAGESVVLEEFSFTPSQEHAQTVQRIGEWLAANALPSGSEYAYWREALPKRLCVLPEDAFRDFARYGTEVQTHVRLDTTTKTVETGALWTAESLPVDTLLYAPLLATKSRMRNDSDPGLSAAEVITKVSGLGLARLQLGGDETTGQGIV